MPEIPIGIGILLLHGIEHLTTNQVTNKMIEGGSIPTEVRESLRKVHGKRFSRGISRIITDIDRIEFGRAHRVVSSATLEYRGKADQAFPVR